MLLFASCTQDRITPDKITAIDDIILGKDKKSFFKQYDSLNIPKTLFFSWGALLTPSDIDKYTISFHYSERFNVIDFTSERKNTEKCKHIGLLYPINNTITDNIVGIEVLLCHTEPAWVLFNTGGTDYGSQKYISQDVSSDLIETIKRLYIERYGEPITKDSTNSENLSVIQGNGIYQFTDSYRKGICWVWKTEYLNITFFMGLKSNFVVFDREKNYYDDPTIVWGRPKPPYEIRKLQNNNQEQCFSWASIRYELNEKAIKLLTKNNYKF